MTQKHTPNSWIIINRATGNAILETFSEKYAKSINAEKYEVLTAIEYLVQLNEKIKKESRTCIPCA